MVYQNKKYISEALRIANDLMSLASEGDRIEDCGSFGILFGVLRDCAYKIRRHAEYEKNQAKMNFLRSNTTLVILAAALLSIVFACSAQANIILSTNTTETLGGLTFTDGDLVEYDPITNTSTLYFGESLFGSDENIDAIHVLSNGNIILSTADGATLGWLAFTDGDLVEYNPTRILRLCISAKVFSLTMPTSMPFTLRQCPSRR